MPAVKKIHEASTAFTFPFGDETINLRVYLERMGDPKSGYRELDDAYEALQDKLREHYAKIEEEAGKAHQVNTPTDPQYLQFRQAFEEHLNELSLVYSDHDDIDNVGVAGCLAKARERLAEFGDIILPSEEQVKKRQDTMRKAMLKLREDIKATLEAMRVNQAKRLAVLLAWWDITETDEPESKMWEISEENILTFSGQLITDLLQTTIKKAQGRSLSQ